MTKGDSDTEIYFTPTESNKRESAQALEAAMDVYELERQSKKLYPNYKIGYLRVIFQLTACIFLFVIWAINPSKATAIIAIGTDYIGAVRKCSYSNCEDWLRSGGGTGTANAGTATSDPTSPPATTSKPTRRNGILFSRAGSDTSPSSTTPDPTSLFISVGLAILTAFYISFYVTIFFVIRLFKLPRPPELIQEPVEGEEKPIPPLPKPGEKRRKIKVFSYHASRSLGIINVILLFGCLVGAGRAVWNVRQDPSIKGSDGIGGGLMLLLFALLFSIYSTVRDMSAPDGKLQKWLSCCSTTKVSKNDSTNESGDTAPGKGSRPQ